MNSVETDNYIASVKSTKTLKKRIKTFIPIFSLLVILIVFWWLKLIGITLAGDAFCGIEEHTHNQECAVLTLNCAQEHEHDDSCYESTYNCGLDEHVHITSCYCDINADLETAADWESTLPEVSSDSQASERIVKIAQSQLGYTESELNFKVDSENNKRGYTRYGEWYGNPYGDWATMFTSFCLNYAGVFDIPFSSGADAMRLAWQEKDIYKAFGSYTPNPGDIIFLDKNGNGTIDTTAVIIDVLNDEITVIEGNLNNSVAQASYNTQDSVIKGYGASSTLDVLTSSSTLINLGAATVDGNTVIAKTTGYDQSLFKDTNSFVLYVVNGSNYYAFDGNGNAVQITIDENGNILSDIEDPNLLLWTFTSSGGTNSYLIKNISTGRYMHAYPNNGSGVTTSGAYPSTLISQTGGGVKIKSNSEFARLNASSGVFQMTQSESSAAVYYFGIKSSCTVWLDGTNGGLMSLGGSLNKSYTVDSGSVIKLPTEWQTPEKYSYKLRGWYDVKNSKYYPAGAEITVEENLVFYADWTASTYDIGQFNSHVANTVSTNNFINTKVFDYNVLFNMLSQQASVTVNSSGHSEVWQQVTSGNVPYKNSPTLDFVFIDYDAGGDISYPNNRGSNNVSGDVYSGLYTDELGNILFSSDNSFDPVTGTGIIGKEYLGMADHLFQVMTDPSSEHYGYYYYDSKLNAASYNQKDNRFYVYEYLERTADSEKDGGDGEYSDFLPFNSPYANTNDNTIATYTYNGLNGEYSGVNHFQYDAKYNTNNNAIGNVGTNYWFGMSIDIDFYLPDAPGTVDENGNFGNQDLYGKDMHFKFSGDDDVWVLVDGKLVLDIGGVHGVESGDINFSTGVVTVNGVQTATLDGIGEGEHILTVYYLERGSSQSNCAIYFNLAPRFHLSIQKEDVLTQELLNGAEFSVYTDKECTVPAELWESKESNQDHEPSTNVFAVKDGIATVWGLSAGKTYYIKETKPPDAIGYSCAHGVICLSLDKNGVASYSVEIIDETDENGNAVNASNGFTVHGFKIDEETQQAYIVVTNAQEWVTETTTVQASKVWNDTVDHTYDSVTVYLTVTDPDGTVRRIREISLSEENDWTYIWTSLPKYYSDGVTEINYGVEEAYKMGYQPSVEKIDQITITTTTWAEAYMFENGGVYILKTANGCLSTTSSSSTTLCLVDEQTAKTSPLALWSATVSGSNVKFTNAAGQVLSFNYSYSSSSRYFYATGGTTSYQNLSFVDSGNGIRLYYRRNSTSYYIGTVNTNGRASATTSSGSALVFTPMTQITETIIKEVEDIAYKITNTPLDVETSLKVNKNWDVGMGSIELYQQAQVTVKLFANGKDTGRTVTLSLKNNWSETFFGLPYTDENGDVIVYTIEESWETDDWLPSYGEVNYIEGDPGSYEVTVTNVYRWGRGYELPSTGSYGKIVWLLSGFAIMSGSLVAGYVLRRKQERRSKQ